MTGCDFVCIGEHAAVNLLIRVDTSARVPSVCFCFVLCYDMLNLQLKLLQRSKPGTCHEDFWQSYFLLDTHNRRLTRQI
jgi:hypothetical protein